MKTEIPKLHLICKKNDLRPFCQYIYWDTEVFCVTDAHSMIIWEPSNKEDLPNQPTYIHMDEWKKLTKKQKDVHQLIFKDVVEYGNNACEYLLQSDMDKLHSHVWTKASQAVKSGEVNEGDYQPYKYPNFKVVWPNALELKGEPAVNDLFTSYGTPLDTQQIGVNASMLADVQNAMLGEYTKLTFYGKTRGILVECPSSPLNDTGRIRGLIMPFYIQ